MFSNMSTGVYDSNLQAGWGGDFGIPVCKVPIAVRLRLRDVEGLILQTCERCKLGGRVTSQL